jgi:hypothetical protein|tara:strand:- start:728 stop:1918 length:1191 start_codon:yes stop_codon:yes gene_type:complete
MGVVGKLLAKLNAFDRTRDGFAGAVTDESEQTKLGAFLSVVILPVCVCAYSALYFVQFYYGFGESAPPLYKVTSSETLQYGNQVKELALECTNPYGCYFRLPAGGASMCKSGTVNTEQPDTDFCDTSSPASAGNAPNTPAPGARKLLDDDAYPWRDAARSLLQNPTEPKCSGKIDCGTVMDGDDGVCAFALADPADALTVAWRDDDMVSNQSEAKCTGHCNFGVSLVTDYLDQDSNSIKQKKIRAHRGITLLSLVERHDPQMEWDSSHPDAASKSSRTVVYEWGITPVDIVGTITESNLCKNDLKTAFGETAIEGVNAKGIKINPFPLYTKVTTSYPSPVMAYIAAVGGIAATLGGMFGLVHTVHLEMLKRKDTLESGLRKTGMFASKPPVEANAA